MKNSRTRKKRTEAEREPAQDRKPLPSRGIGFLLHAPVLQGSRWALVVGSTLAALAVWDNGFSLYSGYNLSFLSGVVLAFVLLGTLVTIPVCTAVALWSHERESALNLLFGSLVLLFFLFIGVRGGAWVRTSIFLDLAERSTPLIHAIEAFGRVHGEPPTSLDQLVPDYLAEVPQTGLGAYPNYRYAKNKDPQEWEGNPWALSVETGRGLSFDRFIYLPLQNYPETGYGGRLQRIADWAYVWE